MQRQFTTFYLGRGLFGIDVLQVREINKNIEITPVDPSPDFVMGLMNLRGQIISVIDLGIKLGLEKQQASDHTCCVVLKTNSELERVIHEGLLSEGTTDDFVGLMVDKIGDMILVEENDIEPPPANINGVDSVYLNGVIKLDTSLIVTLKLGKILTLETTAT